MSSSPLSPPLGPLPCRYEDFVFFILSEEDKANEVSLRYFFDLVDLDCDGVVTAYVLEYTKYKMLLLVYPV